MSSDTIADIITSIRNADMYRKSVVRVASTNISQSIFKILLREGFIENMRKHRENNKDFLVLTLRHRRNRKRTYRNLLNLKRISRPGLRIYSNYQRIPNCELNKRMKSIKKSKNSKSDSGQRNGKTKVVWIHKYFIERN